MLREIHPCHDFVLSVSAESSQHACCLDLDRYTHLLVPGDWPEACVPVFVRSILGGTHLIRLPVVEEGGHSDDTRLRS